MIALSVWKFGSSLDPHLILFVLGHLLRCAQRIVNIMKVYIERNNIQYNYSKLNN